MDSKTALSFITARHHKALEQLYKEYDQKLVDSGGMAIFEGPLFANEPTAVAAYLDVVAWKNAKLEQISEQHCVELQIWFDCFS